MWVLGVLGKMCFWILEADTSKWGGLGWAEVVPKRDKSRVFHQDLFS